MRNRGRLLTVLVLAAAPLGAQQPSCMSGMMMEGPMMEHMGPAMMRMMLHTPQHLLVSKDALGLSADQVTRLTTLRDGAKAAHDAAEADAETHMRGMEQAANAAQPDTAALKIAFQAVHAAMGKVHWATLVSAAQARSVLTDTQRAKMQVWADSMQAWRQQHRQMMPAGPPH